MRSWLQFLLIGLFSAAALRSEPAVERRKVSFSSEGETLAGELVLPAAPSTARRPAVVFLVGSGPRSTYAKHYRSFCQHYIEPVFLPRGYAILYFDKRGVGESTGTWYTADFATRARDAVAAIRFLRGLDEIDPKRIGVAGHSQGVWIAEICAARYADEVAFALCYNGAPYGVREQLINDYESEFLCAGLPPEKAHAKAKRKASWSIAAVSVFYWKDNWKQLRLIKNYDPTEDLKRIHAPTFLVWAENDALAYPDWSMRRMQELFPTGIPGNFRTTVIPGADHGLRLAPRCANYSKYGSYAWADEAVTKAVNAWLDEAVETHVAAPSSIPKPVSTYAGG